MPGILYIVATPIGNLGDISPRIKQILTEVDLILAEDTRVTIKLLNHLGIKKRMVSCHNFNEKMRTPMIAEFSRNDQSIAIVSDAGTPLVSDPGNEIVRQAITSEMKIIPIPGPSAFLLALIASGLPCDRFVFEGFLPNKPTLLKKKLQQLKNEERTLIFYEAPHKLLKTLAVMNTVFGERNICLAREITKLHEEIIRGSLSEITAAIQSKPSKILGEYVLVVQGCEKDSFTADQLDVSEQIKGMLKAGHSLKTVVQELTRQYKLKRSDTYQLALKIQADQNAYNLSD